MEILFGGRDHALSRPVYLSRGWRPAEMPAADKLCNAIKQAGLKMVCDSIDQPHYDSARIQHIMSSTGGLIAILPQRGNGTTSSYLIREIAAARDLHLPCLIFAEKGIAPKQLTGTGKVSGNSSATLTRPLCSYPQSAHYNGTGDTNQAASFTCK